MANRYAERIWAPGAKLPGFPFNLFVSCCQPQGDGLDPIDYIMFLSRRWKGFGDKAVAVAEKGNHQFGYVSFLQIYHLSALVYRQGNHDRYRRKK